VLAKHRFGGQEIEEFQKWKAEHDEHCSINYVGSSNGMKAAIGGTPWTHSVEKY
jgi:hypothetical protein